MSRRLVECQDCGYRWESSADDPRCSKSDCGRSRNVEPVADDLDDEDDAQDQLDDEPSQEIESDQQPVEDESQDDVEDEDDGYVPTFETANVRTDTERKTSTSSTSTDEDESQDDVEDEDEGSDQQPEGPDELPEIDPETLEPALDATFNLLATQRGDHWELEDEEAEKLAEGWCPVINHYAPHFLRQYTEVGAAVIVTYTVLGPRLAEDKRLAELEEKATDDETGTVRQPRTEDDGIDVEDELPDQNQTPADETGEIGGYASV